MLRRAPSPNRNSSSARSSGSPEVPGYITAVPITDNEHVAAGGVIARIDDRTGSLGEAKHQAIQWIGQQLQGQASFLGHMDAFWLLMLISLAAVPLALALRKVKLGGPARAGH